MLGRRFSENETFQQGVGRQAIGSVKAAFGHFASGIEAGQVGAAIKVDDDAATGIMLRRDDRDRLLGDVDVEIEQPGINGREMMPHEFRRPVADVEMDIVQPQALDFMVDGACHDVTRGEFRARVETRHEAFAATRHAGGEFQMTPFAAHRFSDQEILDLQIIEAGGVKLVHLHIGNAAPRAPGHGDAVPCRAARRGGEQIGAACAASAQDGCAAQQCVDALGRLVKGIDAPDMAVARITLAMARGDKVDRDHILHQGDVGIGARGLEQGDLDGVAGGVVDMDDAAVTVPAFARKVPAFAKGVAAILAGVEGHAERREPLDRGGRFGHDEFHRRAIVEARAGDHRVVDMRLETVTRVEYSSNAALRPVGRPAVERALGQHQHLAILREVDGCRQSGGARTDDDDVMGGGGHI